MQKLWCTGFNGFKKIANNWGYFDIPHNIAIISINNSTKYGDECHLCEDGDNVLNLDFEDMDPVSVGLSEDTLMHKIGIETIYFFNDDMANRAVEFIERNKDKDFYIHCSAGVSRSQAFVKYILNAYFDIDWETNPDNPCLYPNGFVYSKLRKAYRNFNFL